MLLVLLKLRIGRFNLNAFDKIQLAIQKNRNEDFLGELTFKDPITDSAIRRPFVPRLLEDTRDMLYLDNFARASEIRLVAEEKYGKVRRGALIMIFSSLIVGIACCVLAFVYSEAFVQPKGWLLMLPLLALVCAIYLIIYGSNVLTTIAILREDIPKIDKDFLSKYLYYRKQFEQF